MTIKSYSGFWSVYSVSRSIINRKETDQEEKLSQN